MHKWFGNLFPNKYNIILIYGYLTNGFKIIIGTEGEGFIKAGIIGFLVNPKTTISF